MNGDGYADLIVGADESLITPPSTGVAFVYPGGVNGIDAGMGTEIVGVNPSSRFGASVASAGDVNGDGFADVVVGAPIDNSSSGLFIVLAGGPTWPPPLTRYPATGPSNSALGTAVAGIGDVTGDGLADVLVGTPGTTGTLERAALYIGATSGFTTSPLAEFSCPDGANAGFGDSVAGRW
jgi:hypothetical protein